MKMKIENIAVADDGDPELDERLPFGLVLGDDGDSDVPQHDGFIVRTGEKVVRVGGVKEQAVHVLLMAFE